MQLPMCTDDLMLAHTAFRADADKDKEAAASGATECCMHCSGDPQCAGTTYHSKDGICRYITRQRTESVKTVTLRTVACTECTSFVSAGYAIKGVQNKPAAPTCAGSSNDVQYATALFREALGTRSTSVGGESTHDFAHADIVMVTAWRRPAFLLQALARLLAATHAEEHTFVFVLEPGYEPLIEAVIAAFPLHKRVYRAPAAFFGGIIIRRALDDQ